MAFPSPARFLTGLVLLLFLDDLISLDIPLTEFSKSPDLAPSAQCSYKVKRSFSWRSILNGIRKPGSRSAAEPVRCEPAHYDSFRPMMKLLKDSNGQFLAKLWIADSQSLSWGCGRDDSIATVVAVDVKKRPDETIAAMVPRGGCSFAEKAMAAQLKGFTALLIENSVGGPPIPPDVSSNPLISIPVVMISQEVGHALRSEYSTHRAIIFNVTLVLAGTTLHSTHSESSASSAHTSAQQLRVVTAIPRGASVTVVQPVVQAVTEAQPFAELVIFTEHDPYHARSIVQLGARITLARLPGRAELPACTLSGALHADCALALMELTGSTTASLWIQPSFDASRVPDLLHAFASLSNQIAASGDGDSTLALASSSSDPLEFDGVPLASEGMHWQCNGALAFWQLKKLDEIKAASVFYRFVLPWNLCTVQCEDDDAELRRGRARFDAPSNPLGQDTAVCSAVDESCHPSTATSTAIDVVIPAHSKDAVTLQRTVAGARRYVVGVRRVIVVSRTRLSDGAEFVAEDAFESYFSLERVEEVLGRIGVFHNNTRTPFGWYFQQLIKFYAPLIIPGIAANVLVLDSDTVFLRPARFFEPDSSLETRGMASPTIFTVTGDESGPQMLHMGRLLPGLVRQHESMSAIAHHMLLNRGVLEMMFAESEEGHGRGGNVVPFHDLFLLEIDSAAEHKKSASEYEIYFNYFYAKFPNQTRVRHAAWCNGLGLAMTQMSSSAVYDFVSFHDTFQKKGCAAFCCCEHHETEARRIDGNNDGA